MRKKDVVCVNRRALGYEERERLKEEREDLKNRIEPHTLGGSREIVSEFPPETIKQMKAQLARIDQRLDEGNIRGNKAEIVQWEKQYKESAEYLSKRLLSKRLVDGQKSKVTGGRIVEPEVVNEVLKQIEDPTFKKYSQQYVEMGRRLYPDNPEKSVVDKLRKP